MAQMISSQCPPETASWAERHLFQCFQSELGKDYKIIHSLPWVSDDQRRLKEGEKFSKESPQKANQEVPSKGYEFL